MNAPLPFQLETDLERDIVSRPEFAEGLWYGKPRRGHPEGAVAYHIRDVLANIDKAGHPPEIRALLRIVAIVHDTFKYKVDRSQPKCGENHHGAIAARFCRGIGLSGIVPLVVELHDEAFNSWQKGARDGDWSKAKARGQELLARLGQGNLSFFLAFFEADNGTDGKTRAPFEWFVRIATGAER